MDIQQPKKDLDRLRKVYSDREVNSTNHQLYSMFYYPYLFASQQRQKMTISALKKIHMSSLANQKVLEIGCGSGGILLEFLINGSNTPNLFGIDLLFNRLSTAKNKLANASFICSDGQDLPFIDRSFNLILQYTALSSILDYQIKKCIAKEMLRVLDLRGSIIWYDFWLNPTNKQTRGIKPKEIRSLFPNCNFAFHKITLAPPIARRIVPISWSFAVFLESLKILNTHYLVIIQKK